ncbi:hypothetical protein HD806DRAFT_551001 [Xylariaceae sp. AK1471]|nr:hypothetical protein HD806DRAFT_551001 [Xylariaceae sp. AK1471]
MSPSRPNPIRKGGQRSRRGCRTCKARHIKCDEARPGCQRCLQMGLACGGYSTTDGDQRLINFMNASPITAYAIPFRIPGSQQDRRLLHYFCVRGADDLSGHLSSDFWTRLVLQYSHHYVSVRQAVVALSCAHQNYTTADDICSSSPADAMAQYSRAMRSLRKYMSAGIDSKEAVSAVVPLICSVIFFCFENTQGNTEAALQHLNSGVAILVRHKENEKRTQNDEDRENVDLLEQILTRLDLQASMFDDGLKTLAFSIFKTIDNAQADLTRLQSWMLQFLISNNIFKFWSENDLPDDAKLEKKAIEKAYTEWNDKFDRLLHTQKSQVGKTLQDTDSITILRIHYYIFQLLLSNNFPYDPSVFSGSSESANSYTLNKILDLVESTPQARGDRSRSLGAETGIIPPLFLIVMKCTDPVIFNRALTLLLNTKGSREGLFNSHVVAEIAMRFASQSQTPPGTVALEWQAGDAIEKAVDGLRGVAKNLGVIS